jgi:hypothetical protein
MSAIARAVSVALISTIIVSVVAGAYATRSLSGSPASGSSTLLTSQASSTSFASSISTSTRHASQSTTTGSWSMPPPKSVSTTYNGTWSFSATTSQGETTLQINANLIYIGASDATFTFGDPTSLGRVVAQNGTVVWQEITTDLLYLQNVTTGRSFISEILAPTSNLQLGQNYTLIVYPQVSSSSGYVDQDLQVKITFIPLAATA